MISSTSDFKDLFPPLFESEKLKDLKLLGQEQDLGILISWLSESQDGASCTSVGLAYEGLSNYKVLCTFETDVNIVQASLSSSKTLLVYNVKTNLNSKPSADDSFQYDLYLRNLSNTSSSPISVVEKSTRQAVAQFIYSKSSNTCDQLLTFIHQTAIKLYEVRKNTEASDATDTSAQEVLTVTLKETIVEAFPWAQWDSEEQILFYIHFRKSIPSCQEDDDTSQAPTLSALQFHQDTPHESVLNTPVNLPILMFDSPTFTYDDNQIPLRVHDDSLNIIVITDQRGLVCICYHYIFQPVTAPLIDVSLMEEDTTVHLAYSVTILHQARVLHCTVPSILWNVASAIKLTFALHNSGHMMVFLPGIFLHVLDIDPSHEPCCHIILPAFSQSNHQLMIKRCQNPTIYVNQESMESINFNITSESIKKSYLNKKHSIDSYLSILHYFLIHDDNFDIVSEILTCMSEESSSSTLYKLFNEFLVGGSYSWVSKTLHPEAQVLCKLLPVTTIKIVPTLSLKFNEYEITIVEEKLLNPAVMLLTRQQRLCPYRADLWTKLWDLIALPDNIPRFKPSSVAEKLMVSLICYQPEALSRCSTPLSPGIALLGNFGLFDLAKLSRSRCQLPFLEIEKCTASKQEHIISVNLRELSVHLVKYSSETGVSINSLATRYASIQMEMSKFLCSLATRAAAVKTYPLRGFQLIENLDILKRKMLFHLLERVMVSADTLAFPLPHGFHSFISYLAYYTLSFNIFLQYVEANVLQLQIDVVKAIMDGLGDSTEAMTRKLRLISLLPRSRAKRLLHYCNNPVSSVLRAREHSENLLSGMENRLNSNRSNSSRSNKITSSGLNIFSSAGRVSPFETFLNLLTAKATLNELDFNLLAEATAASVTL